MKSFKVVFYKIGNDVKKGSRDYLDDVIMTYKGKKRS